MANGIPIIGDIVGALSGARGSDEPQMQNVQLDPQTQGLIDQQAQEAMAPAQADTEAIAKMPEQMFIRPDAMSSAIQSRYKALAKKQIEGVLLDADMRAQSRKAQKLADGVMMSVASQQAKNQQYAAAVNAEMQMRAARDQVRGQLLGAAGFMTGSYLANRPPTAGSFQQGPGVAMAGEPTYFASGTAGRTG